jgi:hypothetical protein
MGPCQHVNEPFGSIKDGEFIWVCGFWLIKKDCSMELLGSGCWDSDIPMSHCSLNTFFCTLYCHV